MRRFTIISRRSWLRIRFSITFRPPEWSEKDISEVPPDTGCDPYFIMDTHSYVCRPQSSCNACSFTPHSLHNRPWTKTHWRRVVCSVGWRAIFPLNWKPRISHGSYCVLGEGRAMNIIYEADLWSSMYIRLNCELTDLQSDAMRLMNL